MSKERKVGLIAGRGRLPFDVLAEIGAMGARSVVIGLQGECNPEIRGLADCYRELPAGQLGAIIETLKNEGVGELVFAGKIGKEALFQGGHDQLVQRILASLPQKNDDAVLLALVNEFARNGLVVAKQTDYLRRLLAPEGMIAGNVSAEELADVKLGFRMAKAIGGLDIGQSVVVKKGVILAVEAIEGTDQAIIRGGSLGGPGAVVVKVSKPNQDERFDVPTIGRTTLESMIQVKAGVLGIEAGKTLIAEKEGLMALAAENRIKIIALQF